MLTVATILSTFVIGADSGPIEDHICSSSSSSCSGDSEGNDCSESEGDDDGPSDGDSCINADTRI